MENREGYNPVLIGNRIKEARKQAGYSSREALIDALRDHDAGMSKPTLSKIENGKLGKTTISQALAMCEIFGCDIGYLLCEYENKTVKVDEIANYTGLPGATVLNLHMIQSLSQDNDSEYRNIIPFIARLLSDNETLLSISRKLDSIEQMTLRETWKDTVLEQKLKLEEEEIRDAALFALYRIIADEAMKMVKENAAQRYQQSISKQEMSKINRDKDANVIYPEQ